jgi:nitrogenase molybdenum-cofactor synthesis protein NifE
MTTAIDKYLTDGCATEDKHKVCRSRGGESCAFDGAMIVLQPIADAAHIIHGPIACCGNSWEGRGTLSRQGDLHRRGFTTDMNEIDIVYGAESKLMQAIRSTNDAVRPKAIFVHATCVSGLIGEDIDAVCRKAEAELGVPVIPVNAPGFVGPKNLGNRIAGEVLLERVIGTDEPAVTTHFDINLIGEYNVAGDLWLVEPLLAKAGVRILARITGNAAFQEITHAHRAKLNVVVCGRALINVAAGMERKYGIPFIEVSFYGRTETSRALRLIAERLDDGATGGSGLRARMEQQIREEEEKLNASLQAFTHLRGKRAVLYTGGVKSWSFISALRDLGIEVVAVGTKKSTFEDEERMRGILGPDAPLVEDVNPGNLKKLLRERNADILVAGGRNRYLAAKEGYPFVDVNQERHTAYAGYQGLVNLAEQISNSMRFCLKEPRARGRESGTERAQSTTRNAKSGVLIDPLKHSPAIGAIMAFQGVHRSLPVLHGAQGCSFLGKVLLTGHFREPIALATSKLFVENVVMGSEESLARTVRGVIEKNRPDVIGVVTTALSEVKGDDSEAVVRELSAGALGDGTGTTIVHVHAPDYEGGLETGYARAVESLLTMAAAGDRAPVAGQVNLLAGPHLTPADVTELREIIEAFGLRPVIFPDLSALDGSRQGFSVLAEGGATAEDIRAMAGSTLTLAVGAIMQRAAALLKDACGVDYRVLTSVAGLEDSDRLMGVLAELSGYAVPPRFVRQRKVLADGMRDAQDAFGGKRVCIALEPDLAVQTTRWLAEMGACVRLAVIPTLSDSADLIAAERVEIGGLSAVNGTYELMISNSHAVETAQRTGASLLQLGFPLTKSLGGAARATVGYRGTLGIIHEAGNLLLQRH